MAEEINGAAGDAALEDQQSPVIMFKWGSKQKPFRCQLCDMSFEDGENLREHMSKHTDIHPQKPFPCKVCPKSFQTSKSLERHALIHYGQALKRCKFCYKVFANKENLEKHVVIHDGKKPFKCSQCGEQFVFKQGLETHMVIHTGVRPYVCLLCNKGFNRKDILERHMIVHSGSKKYKCVECGKNFAHSFVLKRHTRAVHSQEFSGKQCEVCGKFIKSKENIRRHMKLHSGERPYKCSVCEKSFTQKQHAIDHMVIHTNQYPYKCSQCGKEFKYKRSLNRHVGWHEGKSVWPCEFPNCSMVYNSKAGVAKHQRQKHQNHQCTVCKTVFKTSSALKRHYDVGHNDVTYYREIGVGTDDIIDLKAKLPNVRVLGTDESKTKELIKSILGKEAEEDVDSNAKVDGEEGTEGESGKDEIIFIVLENDGQKQIVMENLVKGTSVVMEGSKSEDGVDGELKVTKLRMSDGTTQGPDDITEDERSQLIQTLIEFAEQQHTSDDTGKTETQEKDNTETQHLTGGRTEMEGDHGYTQRLPEVVQSHDNMETEANPETETSTASAVEAETSTVSGDIENS